MNDFDAFMKEASESLPLSLLPCKDKALLSENKMMKYHLRRERAHLTRSPEPHPIGDVSQQHKRNKMLYLPGSLQFTVQMAPSYEPLP